ncbi:MAG TPA: transporter substrate-binding domain-containing protein [Acidobacteriota bacterium]|nr:transporter substrate-binding domain-containing protein [Acidobacteriota bacterium]
MRRVKYLVASIGLLLIANGCVETKELQRAFESMQKNKMVRIGTDTVTAPFVFGDGTGVQGLDVDIGEAIGVNFEHPLRWVKIQGYERLFELLQNGEVEMVISSVAINQEKMQEFAFSQPYYHTGDVIVHQRDSFDIKGLADLSGKQVGVAEGRPGDRFMSTQTVAQNVTIRRYASLDGALGALNRREVDAVVGDEPFVTYGSVKSYPNTAILPDLINKYQYAVVVRKDDTELLQIINKTLDRMIGAGEIAKLEEKWMGDIRKESLKRSESDRKEEAIRRAPKTIDVTINKIGGTWRIDLLDGFTIVLEGEGRRFESTHILTKGNSGACRFATPVPPGNYRMTINRLQLTTDVKVPALPKSSVAMTVNIGATTTIGWK